MSVSKTRSVIDHAREFHEQLGEYYRRLADSAKRTRVRLLLDYMSQHEERLAHTLTDYEHDAPKKILNTWLQSSAETDALATVRKELRSLEIDHTSDVDGVVAAAIKLSECLISVYRDIANRAEPESVREVFRNLLQMEEKALRQFARDAGRFDDL